jgi:hypothetical protein
MTQEGVLLLAAPVVETTSVEACGRCFGRSPVGSNSGPRVGPFAPQTARITPKRKQLILLALGI